jgi:hypothetical protein
MLVVVFYILYKSASNGEVGVDIPDISDDVSVKSDGSVTSVVSTESVFPSEGAGPIISKH